MSQECSRANLEGKRGDVHGQKKKCASTNRTVRELKMEVCGYSQIEKITASASKVGPVGALYPETPLPMQMATACECIEGALRGQAATMLKISPGSSSNTCCIASVQPQPRCLINSQPSVRSKAALTQHWLSHSDKTSEGSCD